MQKKELARFRQLMLEAHRFSTASLIREYVNRIETTALSNGNLTDEARQWIDWAKKKADWYDPTLPREQGDLLEDVDIENLRVNEGFSGFGYGGFGYAEKENNFWKPWWSR